MSRTDAAPGLSQRCTWEGTVPSWTLHRPPCRWPSCQAQGAPHAEVSLPGRWAALSASGGWVAEGKAPELGAPVTGVQCCPTGPAMRLQASQPHLQVSLLAAAVTSNHNSETHTTRFILTVLEARVLRG